jgi:hypothetical protein
MCPQPRGDYCLACRIFGCPNRESAIRFDDLRVKDAAATLLPTRTNVSLSRRLGTAQGERLFISETSPWHTGQPLLFTGHASGRADRDEVGWLLSAMRLVTHLGGSKARGLGNIRLEAEIVLWWEQENASWRREQANTLIEEVLDHAS